MKNVFALCKLNKKGKKSVSGVIKLMPLPGGQAGIGAVEHASARQFQTSACRQQALCQLYRQTAKKCEGYPQKQPSTK